MIEEIFIQSSEWEQKKGKRGRRGKRKKREKERKEEREGGERREGEGRKVVGIEVNTSHQ